MNIRLLNVSIEGREELPELLSNDRAFEKSVRKYEGTFLAVGNYFIPFWDVRFLRKERISMDVGEFGVQSDIVCNDCESAPHGHREGDNYILRMRRRGFVGVLNPGEPYANEWKRLKVKMLRQLG